MCVETRSFFFFFFQITQKCQQKEINPTYPFADTVKLKTCAEFQLKIFNSDSV